MFYSRLQAVDEKKEWMRRKYMFQNKSPSYRITQDEKPRFMTTSERTVISEEKCREVNSDKSEKLESAGVETLPAMIFAKSQQQCQAELPGAGQQARVANRAPRRTSNHREEDRGELLDNRHATSCLIYWISTLSERVWDASLSPMQA